MPSKIKDLDPRTYKSPLPYTPGQIVGDHIYVAGCVSIDDKGNTVGVGDIKAQVRQVFKNIEEVLVLAGANLEHIFKLNVYLTDRAHYAPQIEVRKELFKHYPAATVVVIAGLGRPEWLLEIDCIAVKP